MEQGSDNSEVEARWIEACLNGDLESYGFLVERYERMVRTAVYRIIHNDQDIEELSQQIFLKAFEKLSQYKRNSKFSSWLYQIAINKSRDYLRRNKREAETVDTDGIELECANPGPESILYNAQRNEILQSAMGRLKPKDRELITLKYILEYDYEAVGEILGCSAQTAKVRSMRAREKLKSILTNMGIMS